MTSGQPRLVTMLFTAGKRNSFNKESIEERINQQRWKRKYHRCSHNVVPVANVLPFERIQTERQRKHRLVGHEHERLQELVPCTHENEDRLSC